MDLIVTPQLPSSFGEDNLRGTIVPLFMRLREHHCINPQIPIPTGGKHDGFDDGLDNGWLPPAHMQEKDASLPTFRYRRNNIADIFIYF